MEITLHIGWPHHSRAIGLVIFLITAQFAFFAPSFFGEAISAPTRGNTQEPGSATRDCTYTFYVDGTSYLATKGDGSGNKYSATSFITVFDNSLTDGGDGTYCLTSGIYTVTSALTFSQSNMNLVAEPNTEIRRTAGTGNLFTFSNNIDNVYIKGVKFHQIISPAGAFISMSLGQQNDNIFFEEVTFIAEGAQVGIQTWNGVLTSLSSANVNTNIKFIDSTFDGTAMFTTAPNFVAATGINVQFSGVIVTNMGSGGTGIVLQGLGRQNLDGPYIIERSHFDTTSGRPLIIQQVWGAIVQENLFRSISGILVRQNADYPANAGPNRKIQILGNIIEVNNAGQPAQIGIEFPTPTTGNYDANNTIIQGNHLTSYGTPSGGSAQGIGIYGGVSNSTFSSNTFEGWTWDISFNYANVKQLIIQANFFGGSSTNSIQGTVSPTGPVFITGNIDATSSGLSLPGGSFSGFVIRYNQGANMRTENQGATSVADGGTISHGLVATPTSVQCTASIASQFCSVTVLAVTTFTVAIKTDTGAAGTTQTIYWYALYWP